MLDPVVIGQDEATELHVQAVIQGGRRHLDIRVWRRGPSGFAPSRNAITLDASDLDALQEGITELLEASNGGRQVARVVCDKDEGRRLRAETEPFGTRYLARLGFWQRVRDSWKPAGEGLVLAADKLKPLQALLRDIRPRLEPDVEPAAEPIAEVPEPEEDSRHAWPTPAAAWLTVTPSRVAFHPRGIRLTIEIEESQDGRHRLVLVPWRQSDTLWLTTDARLRLDLACLDGVLACLRRLDQGGEATAEGAPGDQISHEDGSTLWVRVLGAGAEAELLLEELPPTGAIAAPVDETQLRLPAARLSQFGRALWQSRAMLIGHMSAEERERTLSAEELAELSVTEEAKQVAVEEPTPEAVNPEAPADANWFVLEEATMVDWEPEAPPDPVEEKPRRAVSLGDVKLGHYHVFLLLHESEPRELTLQWEGRSLQLPADHLQDLLTRVRDMYYDALRGRRGRATSIGAEPAVTVSVHHQGSTMYLALDQEIGGKSTHLSFPTGQVPAFLNVTESALARL